jgi:hypothetical protein
MTQTNKPTFNNWMQIATNSSPNGITWDLLNELGKDSEITHHLIRTIAKITDFSDDQESTLMSEINFAIESGIINFEKDFLKFINPTDVIYALHKGYYEIFNLQN